MDGFTTSAQKMRVRSTLFIGATFGIFLTIGEAWSTFLEAAVRAIMPEHDEDNDVVRELLYAVLASFTCLLLLLGLVKIDMYLTRAGKAINSTNMKRVAETIPGVRIIERPVIEPTPVSLMGNTKQSHARRVRIKNRSAVRQGFM